MTPIEIAKLKAIPGFYYLASPYTHPDLGVSERRVYQTRRAMGWLMKKGLIIFSPIVLGHEAQLQHDLPTDWEYWWVFNKTFMERSAGCIVLQLPGWEDSNGVKAEIEYYAQRRLPISYLGPHVSTLP